MSLKELERDKTGKAEPQKKTEAPRQWKVVLNYGADDEIYCCACLLSKIFNMSTISAYKHMRNAKKNGTDIIFESTRDIVETKTELAEDERIRRVTSCTPSMKYLKFQAEPS